MASSESQSALVVAAFPGVREALEQCQWKDLSCKVVDLDSPQFKQTREGQMNPQFVEDYMVAIKSHLHSPCILLVSTHRELREALENEDIYFQVIGPALGTSSDDTAGIKRAWLAPLDEAGASHVATYVEEHWDQFVSALNDPDSAWKYVGLHKPLGLGLVLSTFYAFFSGTFTLT